MRTRVLVTGYGGFLGSAICRILLQRGYAVRGIARRHNEPMADLGVEVIVGDVRDNELITSALAGVDAIIHTAALAGVWGRRSDFESINIDATKILLGESVRRGVRAFVYSSSPSVTFNGEDQRGIDESAPYPTRWLCDYPRTKAIAEQAVIQANQPGRFLTCSLRPHLIWGEGDPHLIPRLIQRCQAGKLIRVGSGKNLIDTVHVEAAAEAHVLALERLLTECFESSGRAYFITDGEPKECWQWISEILKGAGLEIPTRAIPYRWAYSLGAALEWFYRVTKNRKEPPMTRFVAAQLGKDHYFSIDAAKQLIGYIPIENRQAHFDSMQPWLAALSHSNSENTAYGR